MWKSDEPEGASPSFDWSFCKRFCKLLFLLFRNRWILVLLFTLILVALCEQFVVYYVGLITSQFYKVLGDKDLNGFWHHSLKSLGLIFAVAIIISTRQYISSVLYITSRQILTQILQRQYMFSNNFYKLNVVEKSIDNPDQRITQDVDKMCNQLSTTFPVVVVFPFTLCYYSYSSYITTGWWGPTGVLAFFLISTIVNKLLMSPIVNLVFQQEKCEGFFRFKHMHIRSNAESIAFQEGSSIELSQLSEKFVNLAKVQQQLFVWQYPLNLSVNLFAYLGSIVSFLLLAYPLFQGKYDNLSSAELSALISKNTFVTMYLISCFTQLVNLSGNITTIAGTTHRISELLEWMELNSCSGNSEEMSRYQQDEDFDDEILMDISNVSVYSPEENKPLISELSCTLKRYNHIVVTGSSSCGKTSLLRVVKGLWPVYNGHVKCKFPSLPFYVFYLPQKPLLIEGTLRQQIVYPLDSSFMTIQYSETDESIFRYLKLADLVHILERIGGLDASVDWNWYDVLSPGEMQRLSFVRLFYHKPILAFLDEATSAIGYEMEEILYNFCKVLGITLFTVGHRKSLIDYHSILLHISGYGKWTLSQIKEK